MAKGSNQKLKALHLLDLLRESTDEEHPATMEQLMEGLQRRGVEVCDRKSLYSDLEELRLYGADIVGERRGKSYGYYLASREFELPELKLLTDAVQSARFITPDKTRRLVGKIESLTSVHQARELQRQVFVANRAKTMNERIYYNVDALHTAIGRGREITFLYFEWALTWGRQKVEKKLRRGGERYRVSPLSLVWEDENYYLVGRDAASGERRHYRVDKMQDISMEDAPRALTPEGDLDPALYAKGIFGMFGGREETVKLRFVNSLIGVVVDRFGQDVFLSRDDDQHFLVTVTVQLSPQFRSWVFGFGGDAVIIEPPEAAEEMKQQLQEALKAYQ